MISIAIGIHPRFSKTRVFLLEEEIQLLRIRVSKWRWNVIYDFFKKEYSSYWNHDVYEIIYYIQIIK